MARFRLHRGRMSTSTLLQDTIDLHAPAGTGDAAVLHQALKFFLRTQLGATQLPPAPNLSEQRKMLPLLEGFAKAMIICAAGDGELAPEERTNSERASSHLVVVGRPSSVSEGVTVPRSRSLPSWVDTGQTESSLRSLRGRSVSSVQVAPESVLRRRMVFQSLSSLRMAKASTSPFPACTRTGEV